MSGLLGYALAAHEAGLCVVPPRQDGSKRPIADWKCWQSERPSPDVLCQWYSDGCTGIGFVCGQVSGNLELFEFDDPDTYERYRALAAAVGLGDLVERIEDGYLEHTPGGGVHWLYRCSEIGPNTQLARRPKAPEEMRNPNDKIQVKIESRGEGGYTVAALSNGTVHPSLKPYELVRGSVATIPTITPSERQELWDLARTFDEMPSERAQESEQELWGLARELDEMPLESGLSAAPLESGGPADPLAARALARLLSGMPPDERVADSLAEPWRELANVVLSANGTDRTAAFLEAISSRPDAAELRLAVFSVDPSAEPPTPPPARFTAIGAADVMARPDPTWVVYRHLAVGQVSVWVGRPGSTKTFGLIDLSGDTATGLRWLDRHEVRQGGVVYISAEGVGGMAKRLRAWVRRRGAALEQLHFIEQAPNLTDPDDVGLLIAQIQSLSNDVQLVVLDPLNFCLGDGDENTAGDMGKAMASLQRIARTLACHVAVAHHANKLGSEERGSSAIRAAADTMVQVTNEDGVIRLECTKQRDAEQFAPVHLQLVVVPEDDSCIVEPSDQASDSEQLSAQQHRALEALHSTALDEGASNTEWMDVSGLQRSTFYFARKKLLDAGYVTKDGRRFSLSEKGRLAVAPSKEFTGLGAARDECAEEKSNAAQGNESGGDSKGTDLLVQESNGSPMGVQLDKESNSPMSPGGRRPLDSWTGRDSVTEKAKNLPLAGEPDNGEGAPPWP